MDDADDIGEQMERGCDGGAQACERPDDTGRKQGKAPPFAPGQSGNPKGRPRGARNKLGEAFLDDLLADWSEHGPAAIATVRETKPDVYLKVIASILPRELNLKVGDLDELTDDQVAAQLRAVIRQMATEGITLFDRPVADGPDESTLQ